MKYSFSLLLFCVFSAYAHSSDYQKLEENISALAQNKILQLENLKQAIADKQNNLSSQEREALIEQLESLKKSLCTRPGAGLLTLPLLATTYFGIKSCFSYYHMKNISNNSFLQFLLGDKVSKEFVFNFSHFIILLTATFLIELEYRESASQLFTKERKLEKEINEIIASLNKE